MFFFTSEKSNSRHNVAKWPPSDTTSWTLTLQNKEIQLLTFSILFLISVSNVVEFPTTDSTSNYKTTIMNFHNFINQSCMLRNNNK